MAFDCRLKKKSSILDIENNSKQSRIHFFTAGSNHLYTNESQANPFNTSISHDKSVKISEVSPVKEDESPEYKTKSKYGSN